MSTQPIVSQGFTPGEQLRYAREIIQIEGDSLLALSRRLDGEFAAPWANCFTAPAA